MSGYDFVDEHLLMLSDEVRTNAYRAAIEDVVKPGMAVLDFGTGSGVLAFFAARAGARRVYAVDRSPFLRAARALAKHNGLDVTFIQSDGETFELPEKVDVIVSECMGHYALNEHMIEAVLRARDLHLAPNGVVVPRTIELHAALATKPLVDASFFATPRYGFDFTPLRTLAMQRRLTLPVAPEGLVGATMMGSLDLEHDKTELATTRGKTALHEPTVVHALVGWFDTTLSAGVELRTGPAAPQTHWHQSVFPFETPVTVPAGEVEVVIDPIALGERNFWRWGLVWPGGQAFADNLVRLHFMHRESAPR